MPNKIAKPLLGKIKLEGILRAVTGLHIGASKEVLEIGALDLPVVRNPITREPYVPGSSLKGKLRSLLERKRAGATNANDPAGFFNRDVFRRQIFIHVCPKKEDAIQCPVCRLFGSSADRENAGSNFPARLKVRDAFFTPYTRDRLEQMETGLFYTELKFENTLDRVTAAANPRQIERVPAGSDFAFELVYDVEDEGQLQEDLDNLLSALEMVEDDALGGHGSRGSGKVRFHVTRFLVKKAEAYWKQGDGLTLEILDPKGLPADEKGADSLHTLHQAKEEMEKKKQEILGLFKKNGVAPEAPPGP